VNSAWRLVEPAFRGAQIYHALYAEKKNLMWAQITNLPAALRERFVEEKRELLCRKCGNDLLRADGSVRYLLGLGGGWGTGGNLPQRDTEKNGKRKEARPLAESRLRWKRCSCRARGGRRFAFRRRQAARSIVIFA